MEQGWKNVSEGEDEERASERNGTVWALSSGLFSK